MSQGLIMFAPAVYASFIVYNAVITSVLQNNTSVLQNNTANFAYLWKELSCWVAEEENKHFSFIHVRFARNGIQVWQKEW